MITVSSRIVLSIILYCLSNSANGQNYTKKDTTQFADKIIYLECPTNSKVELIKYEEGFFKTINCFADSVLITIHCGRMVNLPLTNLKDKVILSEFLLTKDIQIIRGYQNIGEKRAYFREDNYFRYGITLIYENVGIDKLSDYERYFNNIKILNNK